MKKATKAVAALMLMTVAVFVAGCTKPDDPNNEGNDNGSDNSNNGVLNGLFWVSATEQVRFSQGNLQYQASSDIWRFAENQWDCIGEANNNTSSSYNGWTDIFSWSWSGHEQDFLDWGVNAISNGGNVTNVWRTLTGAEWRYLLFTRGGESGLRFAKAKVNGMNGVILLPEGWKTSIYNLNSINLDSDPYDSNVISATDWINILEANGAVFLPAAGYRSSGTSVIEIGSCGRYWSATWSGSADPQYLKFGSNYLRVYIYQISYNSVRLVRTE